jgi:hypothetical protein
MNDGELVAEHCLRYMERLRLSCCSNFSLDALKRMIVAHRLGDKSPPLSLELESSGPFLSEDDISWLNANLRSLEMC